MTRRIAVARGQSRQAERQGMVQLLGISGSLRAQSYCTAILTTLAESPGDMAHIRLFPLDALPLYNEDLESLDRKSTRLNSSHYCASRMPSSACKNTTQHHTL